MANLREERPAEFSDDVLWYKYFNQTLLITLLLVGVIDFIIIKVFIIFHLFIVGLFLSIVSIILAVILVMVPIPKGNLIGGSGILLYDFIFRRFCRKRKGRIYIKNLKYENEENL